MSPEAIRQNRHMGPEPTAAPLAWGKSGYLGGIMDEKAVREHALAHARAVLGGDLTRASEDLSEPAMAQAPGVMKRLPRPVKAVAVDSVEVSGEAWTARINYSGDDRVTLVDSRWSDIDGRPQIVDLHVVD